jgi:hypothetical protein
MEPTPGSRWVAANMARVGLWLTSGGWTLATVPVAGVAAAGVQAALRFRRAARRAVVRVRPCWGCLQAAVGPVLPLAYMAFYMVRTARNILLQKRSHCISAERWARRSSILEGPTSELAALLLMKRNLWACFFRPHCSLACGYRELGRDRHQQVDHEHHPQTCHP